MSDEMVGTVLTLQEIQHHHWCLGFGIGALSKTMIPEAERGVATCCSVQ